MSAASGNAAGGNAAGEPDRDTVLRAITNDNAFRVIVARTSATVAAAIAAQEVHGEVARSFAELLTGAVLVRETMAPDFRLQGILTATGGGGRLVADASPGGGSRGLVTEGRGGRPFTLEGGALLRVSRALPGGRVHESVVEVAPRATVSEALMTYMQESEQVVSVVAVGTLGAADAPDRLAEAAGYVVQLLPEAERRALAVMTERLAAFASVGDLLRGGLGAAALLEELLHGMPYTQTGQSSLRFHCGCSQERVERAIELLDRAALEELASDGKEVEIRCDYCRTPYRVAPAVVKALLRPEALPPVAPPDAAGSPTEGASRASQPGADPARDGSVH